MQEKEKEVSEYKQKIILLENSMEKTVIYENQLLSQIQELKENQELNYKMINES